MIKAYLKLGVRAVIVHPLQRAWRGEPGGDRFSANFFPERLIPTTAEDRQQLREASRCVACRLCDAAAARAGCSDFPSLVPLVFARSSVELPQAREALVRWSDRKELLAEAEQLCPTEVPLARLVAWLSERLTRVDRARGEAP